MQTDIWGHPLDIDPPETVRCTACHARAERLSSAWQGEGIAYHNYQCRADGCPAGGTIVEHKSGEHQQVGPVFGDRDLAVRLAMRDHPEAPVAAKEMEVRA